MLFSNVMNRFLNRNGFPTPPKFNLPPQVRFEQIDDVPVSKNLDYSNLQILVHHGGCCHADDQVKASPSSIRSLIH